MPLDPLPRLRHAIQTQPLEYQGEMYLMVRDALELSPRYLLVPAPLTPLLNWMDGQHSLDQLHSELEAELGFAIQRSNIDDLVQSLDEALLLDNASFAQAQADALTEYRQASARLMSCAPGIYPAERTALEESIKVFATLAGERWAEPPPDPGLVRAILSPHIDYARGGSVYWRTWNSTRTSVQAAEVAVLIGTDHFGSRDLFTLTRQHYATPHGVLPTEQTAIERLIETIDGHLGNGASLKGEIRHRKEHSLELVAVWLHAMRNGQPLPVIPILTGNLDFDANGALSEAHAAVVQAVIDTLHSSMHGRNWIVVASGDLAHVGPVFGGERLYAQEKRALRMDDEAVLASLESGDAGRFLATAGFALENNNICGVTPFYLTMRLLGPTSGIALAYDQCPADAESTSIVSICGAALV